MKTGQNALSIAVASGKGGTGKTTISTNLALVLAQQGRPVELLDCDVEEPNCHIFLKPEIYSSEQVSVMIPQVVGDKCTGCGVCASVCEYSAIIVVNGRVLVFPELCHSCGGCSLFCPENALEETGRRVGVIEKGTSSGISFVQGLLDIREMRSPAIIKGVKASADTSGIIIIDSPPGTSCPVIESVKDADFIILVTEPTPFGLNDLELAVGMVRELGIPFAVAINRCDMGDGRVQRYCQEESIPVILEIPDDIRIAQAYSRGEMMVNVAGEYKELFAGCLETVIQRAQNLRAAQMAE